MRCLFEDLVQDFDLLSQVTLCRSYGLLDFLDDLSALFTWFLVIDDMRSHNDHEVFYKGHDWAYLKLILLLNWGWKDHLLNKTIIASFQLIIRVPLWFDIRYHIKQLTFDVSYHRSKISLELGSRLSHVGAWAVPVGGAQISRPSNSSVLRPTSWSLSDHSLSDISGTLVRQSLVLTIPERESLSALIVSFRRTLVSHRVIQSLVGSLDMTTWRRRWRLWFTP
jgi:hypothetical protein